MPLVLEEDHLERLPDVLARQRLEDLPLAPPRSLAAALEVGAGGGDRGRR